MTQPILITLEVGQLIKGPDNPTCVFFRKSVAVSIKEGGGRTKCCAWQHQGRGGPRNALGYRPEPEVLPLPAETSREAPKCCAWQHQGRGGPRNALGYRPEPEVLPLPAETSREAPKCCAGSIKRGGPETRSGTVQSLKCCPCQQKRAARLPSAAPGSIKGGGPKRARAPSRA